MEAGRKLEGRWANDYGSEMELAVEHGIVRGVYRSTEGDAGRYRVTGIVDEHPGPHGLTLGLVVSWRNLDSKQGVSSIRPCDQEEASAHWTTTLTGQMHHIDGRDVLTTTFLLTRNTPAENRWEDTVVNTMVFRRIGTEPRGSETGG